MAVVKAAGRAGQKVLARVVHWGHWLAADSAVSMVEPRGDTKAARSATRSAGWRVAWMVAVTVAKKAAEMVDH